MTVIALSICEWEEVIWLAVLQLLKTKQREQLRAVCEVAVLYRSGEASSLYLFIFLEENIEVSKEICSSACFILVHYKKKVKATWVMYYLQKNLDTQQCKSREYELGVQLIAPGHESCQNLSRIVPEYLNQVLFWENLSFVELYKKILWNTTQVVKPNVRKWVVLFQSSSYSLPISTSKSAVHPPVSHIPVDGKFWSKAFEVLGKWVTVKKLVGLVRESATHSRKWVACCNFVVCWLWTLFNWIQLLSDRCEP